MSDSFDGFGDVINNTRGIFGEELRDNDSVRSTTTREGVVFEFYCQGCGGAKQITAEWPEMIALKYGVNPGHAMQGIVRQPTNWYFMSEENAWRPDMRCPVCQFGFCLRVAPHEPGRFIDDARRRRFLDPGAEAQLSARAGQMAQQLRQR